MATIKSYTDLEQSKKLAEILPLESADMYYCYGMDINTKKWDYDIVPTIIDESNQIDIGDIPCWSLAALSEFILPSVVDDDGNNYKFYLSKDGLDRWIAYYKSCDVSIHICEESDNMIDVIFEMICWLKAEKYILL